jgi:hypothetical protein
VELLGDREHHVEVRTVGEPPADLLGPLHLPRPQTVGTVAVATGTRVPLLVVALVTACQVAAETPLAAVGDQVERGVLVLAEPTWPEVAPLS